MSELEDLQEWLEYLEKNLEDGLEMIANCDYGEIEHLRMDVYDGHYEIEMVATTTDSEALAKEYGPSFTPEKIVTNGKLRDKIAEARTMLDSYLRY